MRKQTTSTILMVRPANFGFNEETAANNAFQQKGENYNSTKVRAEALAEFDAFVEKLEAHKIDVVVIDDSSEPVKPDAVFPNNWFSTHQEGIIAIYPMQARARQKEVRLDVIEILKERFNYIETLDLTSRIKEKQYLEGTGSLVLDRVNKVAYACYSQRTDKQLLEEWGEKLGYETIGFHAVDATGQPIYHTNVMMAMGDHFVVICMDSIKDETEQALLRHAFSQSGKAIIDISLNQMNQFAGNMLQVENSTGQTFLIMSQAAYDSLKQEQIDKIELFTTPLIVPIPTIEQYGGGSVRCMIAEIF